MSDIDIRIDLGKVAHLLKIMVNTICEAGQEWYPEVIERKEDGPNVFELNFAIRILEKFADENESELKIVDDLLEK